MDIAVRVAGAAVGFVASGFQGAIWGWGIAGTLYGIVNPPDVPEQREALASLKIQKSMYGAMIPIVYGTCRTAGIVVWGTDMVPHPHRTESGGGKDFGGGGQVSVTYTYTLSFAVIIMDGSALGIRKIWRNGALIYDSSAPGASLANLGITVMLGAEDQVPSSLMETHLGAGNVPAYRGVTMLVFQDHDVTDIRAIPNIECEVVATGTLITLVPQEWVTLPGEAIYEYPAAGLTDNYLVAQSTPGSYRTWLVLDDGGNPRKLGLYNNYSESFDRILTFDGDIAIAGVTDDGAAWISVEGGASEGLRRVTTGGTIETKETADPARYQYIVEVGERVFASYNSTFASTQDLRMFDVDGLLTPTTLSTGRSMNYLLTRAAKVSGRVYVAQARLNSVDPATGRLGYANALSGAFTVIRSYDKEDQFPHGIVGASHIFVRSANTNEGNVIEKLSHDGALVDSVALSDMSATTYTGTPQFTLTDDEAYLVVSIGAAVWKIATGTMEEDLANTSAAGTDEAMVVGSAFSGTGALVTKIGTDNTVLKMIPIEQLITVAPPTRAEVVEDLITRSPLTSGDLDLDALDDAPDVQGFVLTQQGSIRDAITQLQPAYPFDLFEEDYLIKAGVNNGASVVTIPEIRLGARSPDEQSVDPIKIVRRQEIELPRRFTLNYLSLSNDYQVGTQQSKRIVTESQQDASVGVAEAMTDEVAAQAVERLMWMAWLMRESYEWQTSGRYRLYGPCTQATLVSGGVSVLAYATEKHEGANGLIKWRGVPNATVVFEQVAPGVDTGDSQTTEPLSPTESVFLDIHLLRDVDDFDGEYIGAAPLNPDNWSGSLLRQSNDDEVTYADVPGGTFSVAAGRGVALTALGPISADVVEFFDWAHSVQIYVDEGVELSSYTRDQILAGTATAYLLGPADEPGGEIFFARTATLDAERTYTLTGLLRARKGTEEYTDHAIGDRFVVLNTALRSILQSAFDIGVERDFKMISLGATEASALNVEHTNTNLRKKPLAGVHLGGGINAAGDIVIKWDPRTRYYSNLATRPVGEASERYEVDIYHGGVFVRTLGATDSDRITTPRVSYTAAMQTADFGSARLQIYAKVYQMSETYGRGYALEGNVPGIAGYEYFRIFNPTDAGGGVINLCEIRLIDMDGEDVTDLATVTSDAAPNGSTPGGGTIAYLTDDSLSTSVRWNPSSTLDWVKFALPSRRMLAGFKFGGVSSTEYLATFDAQGSRDDSNWDTRKSLVSADLPYPGDATLSGLVRI